MSPTLSLAMTQAGMILGTAAYMSPEQARGKPVDKRADIWAIGVVLFEVLAGRMVFGGGETITDTIASVVKEEPDWKALPADTPKHIRWLLRRCLQKDPKRRLRDVGDAQFMLEDPPEPEEPAVAVRGAQPQLSPLWWALVGILSAVFLTTGAIVALDAAYAGAAIDASERRTGVRCRARQVQWRANDSTFSGRHTPGAHPARH
jgi:hypothetical protein